MENRVVGRIWRIAKTPVTLLALLLLVFFAARWGYTQVTAPNPPPYVEPCVDQSAPNSELHSNMVTVRVFNASDARGKAADVAQQLKIAGFKVPKVTNAKDKMPKTTVSGFSADSPEVKMVAGFFKKVDIQATGRADHSVEVYIGGDYDGMNPNAPTMAKLPSDTVCLPKQPTVAPN